MTAGPLGPDRDGGISNLFGGHNPGVLETYDRHWWRDNYAGLEGLQADREYDYYEPGFQYGWEAAREHRGRGFHDVEDQLKGAWSTAHGHAWEEQRHAVRHAFDRAMRVFEGQK